MNTEISKIEFENMTICSLKITYFLHVHIHVTTSNILDFQRTTSLIRLLPNNDVDKGVGVLLYSSAH